MSFVHVAVLDGDENPLTNSPAFAAFQAGVSEAAPKDRYPPTPRPSGTFASCRSGSAVVRKVGGTVAPMRPGVIVLNGGSSLRQVADRYLPAAAARGDMVGSGIDDLIRALSHGPTDTTAGGTLEFTSVGSIVVGAAFRRAEAGWYQGLGAMACVGAPLIIDEVFLDGGTSEAWLRIALGELPVVWVGVQCQAQLAEARELQRSDRNIGLARDQAQRVHRGVVYDVVVDTSATAPDVCVLAIITWMNGHDS